MSAPLPKYLPTNLLPTKRIIEIAKSLGLDFGPGNPEERIRYFVKLGILPHAVRLAVDGQSSIDDQQSTSTIGHLPYWTIQRLIQVDRLKRAGKSYPQIAEKFKTIDARYTKETLKKSEGIETKVAQGSKNLSLPSEEEIEKRLAAHNQEIDKKLKQHKTDLEASIPISPAPSLNPTDYSELLQKGSKEFKIDLSPDESYLSNKPLISLPKKAIMGIAVGSSALILLAFISLQIPKIKGQIANGKQGKQVAQVQTNQLGNLGKVLAASTETNRLYIDATTEFKGETTFLDDITAPNVVYGVTGGTGISVTTGQNPVVSLNAAGLVQSVNSATGALTLKASGAATISTSGSTITISATDTIGLTAEVDTLATVTSRGATTTTASIFSGGLTVGTGLTFSATAGIANLAAAGTLAFKDGTNTLFTIVDQGTYGTIRLSDKGSTGNPATCIAGDIYFNGTDTNISACTATDTWEQLDAGGVGGIASLSLAGDSGTTQTLTDANTITIAGGTNGIDTAAGATDTITLNLDSTEIGTTTFGSGAAITWTFDASAGTDTTMAWGDNTLTLTEGTTNITSNATTGNSLSVTANSLTSGNAASISSTSTAGTESGTSYLLNLSRSGANSNASHTAYGVYSAVTNTGTTSTNTAGYFSASGATNNYGAYIAPTSGGTTNVGLCFDCDGTWTSSTVASGIQFGTDANAVTLYRSANDTLKTDDSLVVGGTSATITGVEGSNGLILTAGDAAISDGSLLITDDDDAVSLGVTNNTATTIGAGINTAGVIDFSSTSLTTGNLLNLETTTALTTGRMLNISSTSTALTGTAGIGSLANLDWSPGSATTATGDLFALNIGTNGTTTGNLFNILDAGSSLFSVSETAMTSNLPASFNSAGDVAIAYDINFTNPTASYIKSAAPLYMVAGETFNSSDLTLQTYNFGSVIVDSTLTTSSTASTKYALQIATGDTTTTADTIYGLSSVNTLTGAAAKTGYGLYSSVTSSSTTADTLYGIYSSTAQSGVSTTGTKSNYGIYSAPTDTAANSGGTVNLYGEYLAPSSTNSTTGATVNVYGSYISGTGTLTTGGTMNQYGLYVANGTSATTGTSTKYGLYVEDQSGADTNIDLNFTASPIVRIGDAGVLTFTEAGGNNTLCTITDASNLGNLSCTGNITGSSSGTSGFWTRTSTTLSPATANDIVSIANTTTTGADLAITNTGVYTGTGIFNLTANSATTGTIAALSATGMTTGEILDITGTWAAADGSDNEAIDINLTYTPTTLAGTFRGLDLNVTEGANALANTDYALKVTMDNSANTSTGTHTVYGGHFTATGKTAGTTTAVGLYATATGADNNYAAIFESGNVGIGTTAPDAALEINHATGDSLRLTYNDADGSATNYTDFSLSSTGGLTVTGSAATLADGASAEKTFLTLTPGTITLTGTTTVTSVMDTAIVTGATIAASAATIVSDAAALTVTAPVDSTNATLTRSEAIRINDTTSGAGVLTSLIGLYIAPQTGGATNNYGLCFDCDGTWTSSTVASGIQFGTDANAVTLYRSANDTLLTDDSFVVGGATSATETLANTGFVMGADDLFVAGMAGVEGSVYTDGSFIAGASTTYGNGSISQTSGETLTIGTTAANLALQTTTSGDITATLGAATGLFNILTGNLKVGAGTPGVTLDGADAYITGTLEVDGVAQFDGGVTFGSTFNCTDCIDFDDIANSPTLDETTDINLSTLDLYVDLTSTGVLAIRDVATAYWTFDDDSTVDVLFPAAGTLGIDASTTANTTTAGVIDLNVTSLTHDNRGLDIAYTSTAAGATTTVTQYGISNVFSSTQAVTATSPTFNYYGLYQTAAKSGADVLTTGGTFSTYGVYATASNTSTDVSAAGTRNTYGGYFDATGASGGTTQAFGLYVADVSGADTNVALCFDCDGTWTSSTVASGIQFGTDANAVTLYRSANDTLKTDDSLVVGTDLSVNGATTLGDAATDAVTVTGEVRGASPLSFEGLTDDNIYTIFAITDPTVSNKTITFPNATGTVAVSATSPVTLSALGDIGCASCLVSGSGGTFALTLSGDSGDDQTINAGNTIEIAGGTNGIDTVGAATDTITLNLDTTEIGTTTFGSGAAITWTFDASAGTDTTIAFGDNTINATAGTVTVTGDLSVTGNTQLGNLNTADTLTGTLLTSAFTSGATTQTANAFSGTAFTTGELLDLTGTFAPADGSTNEAIDINITHTPTVSADNFRSIELTTTDGTALGNQVYGLYNTVTLTGNAAKIGVGYQSTVTSSSTTADTLYGYIAEPSVSGIITTGTRNVYGNYSNPSVGAESTGGTTNVYGIYSKATGDVGAGGTINNYGVYVANGTYDTDGTSQAVGLYVEAISGADTNTGVSISAASTYTLVVSGNVDSTTAPGGIFFGTSVDTNLYRSAASTLFTDDSFTTNIDLTVNGNTQLGNLNTADTLTGTLLTSAFTSGATTQSVFSIASTTLTTGEIMDITSTHAAADGSDNEAIDINLTYTPTTLAGTFRGLDLNVTEGANALANTDYALKVTMDNSANTSTGTHTVYGGHFTATGKVAGTTTAVGLYATASGADNNYAAIFDAGNVGIGTTTPGQKLTIASGNVKLDKAQSYMWNDGNDEIRTEDNPTWLSANDNVMTFKAYNGNFVFRDSNASTNSVVIKSGNVGIGTSAPDAALEINHATGDSLRLTYNDADGSATTYTDFALSSAGLLTLAANGSASGFALSNTQPAAVGTTPGTAATSLLATTFATGGNTTIATTGVGGVGSGLAWTLGTGGTAASATTASTGGAGGAYGLTGGTGGASAVVGTTNVGGAGGAISLTGGTGGAASGATSNTGGAGGAISITSGAAGSGGNANGGTLTLNSGAVTGTGTSTLNIATSNTTALEIGDSTVTKTIDIGGVTSSDASTISIATNSTAADTLAIGNSNASTTLALTGGDDWSITTAGAAAFGSVLQAGGATATTYSRLGTATAGAAGVTASNDLLISGDLEVDLTTTFDGTVTFNSTQTFNSDVDLVFAGSENMTITNTTNTLGAAGMLDLASTSSTTDTRTLDLSTTFTSTGATTSYGLYNAWASSAVVTGAAVSQTAYGIYNTATKTGADDATGTYSLYGSYNTASNTGRTAVGTVNTYGGYFDATGDAAGATSAYGVYIDNVSGADTNVALCFDCDGTWTASTVASGIQFGTDANAVTLYRDGNDLLRTDDGLAIFELRMDRNDGTDPAIYTSGTNRGIRYIANGSGGHSFQGQGNISQFAITSTASAVNYLQVTGATTGNNATLSAQGETNVGINITPKGSGNTIFTAGSVGIGDATPDAVLDIDSTATTTNVFGITNTSFTTGEAIDLTGTWAAADASDNEAIDINLTYTPTVSAGTFRGLDLNVTEGANALANTDYALKVTMDNSANTSTGTHTVYGGHFTAAGKTAGTATAVGLYATATGADNNYAAIFDAGNVGIGTTSPGANLQVDGSSNVSTVLIGGTNSGANANSLLVNQTLSNGAGTLAGAQIQPTFSGGSSNAYGVYSQPATSATAITVASLSNFYAANPTKGAGSTITTAYGLYLESISSGSTNYSIYSAGGTNYFGGTVGIGTTAPDAALEINHATGDSLRLTYNDADGTATNYTDFSLSSTGALTLTGSAATLADSAAAEKTFLTLTPGTITLTGPTAVTSVMDTTIITGATIAATNATTVNDAAALTVTAPVDSTNATLTRSEAIRINDTTSGAGVLTSLIGLYIAPQTGGATNNIGLCFDCDGTWTSSTVASGIQFGTDANAVTLYRSASDTLKTDDDFSANNIVAAGNINLNNILYSNNDIYLDLDENNDGSNSLFVRDGANATILTLAESGNITATGTLTGVTDLTVNGNTQLGNSNTVDTLTGTLLTSAFTSGATTQSVFSVASTTLTTGEIMDITSTHAPADGSTNEAIDINITHTPTVSADNFRGIELALTDATALANTVYGMVLDVQLSGNAGKIGTGIQSSISSASTTSDILYGFYAAPSLTAAAILGGVGTRSVYGVSSNPIVGAESTAGITNVYGVYSKADGDVAAGGTINNYGLYVANGTYDTEGTSASYGLYVEPIAGADTNVALCFDCDGTWTSSTVASGIQFGTDANAVTLYRSASDTLKTDDSLLVAGTSATITGVEGSNGLVLTAGDAVISDGSLLITDDDDAVSLGVTNNTATTIGAGINTAGVIDFSSTSLTTGNLLNLETTTTLTTGRMLNISSTSTALTGTAGIGSLANLDWSPGSATTATGDLFALNIGTNGTTTGNLFNILDAGSSLFSVSETAMTSNLPASFNSAGDVAIAYDINFTNPTASYIKSAAPMSLVAGETFNSSDLTLQTYNFGSVIVDSTLTTSSTASTKYALQIATGDTTTTADTVYGLSSVNTLTGAAAKIGYGLYSSVTSSSTTADTLYGIYSSTTQSGAATSGTKNNYGLYLAPTDTGVNTSTATVNLYGGYTAPSSVASTTATVNVYGQYIANTAKVTSTGTVNSYGLYIANGTMDTVGTSTQYGLYVASPTGADTNYAAIFAGGNVGIGTTTPGDKLHVQTTTGNANIYAERTGATASDIMLSPQSGIGYVGTRSYSVPLGFTVANSEKMRIDTSGNVGIGTTAPDAALDINHATGDSLRLTYNDADGTATNYTDFSLSSTGALTLTGSAATLADSATAEKTFFTLTPGTITLTGPTAVTSVMDTTIITGATIAATNATTVNDAAALTVTAPVDSTNATLTRSEAIRINDTASGAGVLTSLIGLYIAPQTGGATTNYGLCFDCDGTFGTQTVASGIAWGTDATTANNIQVYRSADGTFLTELGDGTDLILASAADFKINLGAQVGGTAQRLCHAGADASTGVESIGDCGATQADLAEYYGVEGGATEGDLVAKYEASQVETDKGPTFAAAVKKTSTAYDPNILGIISTNPAGEILGEASLPYLKNPKPVALAGRVPVKVSTENGPIKSGDSITSSSTPGVGMKATKAGRVIGMALESFACSSSDGVCQSKILVFVNPSNYLGTLMAQTILGEFAIENFGQPGIDNAFYNADGTLKEQFEGQILTAEQIDRMIKEGIAYELAQVQDGSLTAGQGDFLNPEASSSAQLLAQANEAIQQLNNLLASTNVPKLTVTESAFLPQTQFAGAISQDGTLIIDQGKQLNVLGSALYLQNNIFAQDPDTGKILDIGSGKVTIDKFGNVVISGELSTDSIETKELGIKTQNIGADTVGSATLDYGSVSKTIYTTAVKPGAKILVTATTATGGRNLYVSQKLDYEGFVVTLDGTRAAQNIQFDWLIVSTLGQR